MRRGTWCAVALAALGSGLLAPQAGAQQRGGELTYLSAADVDYLDPGQTYYTFGYVVQMATHRTLYTLTPQSPTTPVPDLAAGPPEISANRRTITVGLRAGVRFAPPVNREVKAGDVKYAMERAFSSSVASGYATSYFDAIKGAPRRPTRRVPRISGIKAIGARTLRISLKRPVADTIAAALVMPITAPVPPGYARRDDRKRVSTYDRHPVATGPYMVVARRPGRAIRLARNPNWDAATDVRPAYLDAITIKEGQRKLSAAVSRAAGGSHLVCCDSGQPPLGAITRVPAEQVARTPSGGTRWIALNTRIKPFNRLGVRRAVAAGMDREALRATRGGAVVGPVASHVLPPGIPGHDEAADATPDVLAQPGGNPALSQALFRKAGFKRGHYTGRKTLLVVATNADPGRSTARVAVRQLRRMGFRLRVRHVPQDRLYTRWCGVPRARVAICPNVGWFKDYVDPQPMLQPTFSGAEIRPAGNVNWSQLRVPGIDRAMRRATTVPIGPARNAAWAAIDKRVTAQAAAIPYVWDDSFNVRSADVDGVVNPFTTAWDLSWTSLR